MNDLFADETILARWLNNELTAAELKALQEHEAYADLQAIVQEVDQLELEGERDVEADYSMLRERIEGREFRGEERGERREVLGNARSERRVRVWRWAAVAAVLVVSFAAWFLLGSQPTTYLTQAGERQEILLPDGSSVVLNAVSELRVFDDGWADNRAVELEGEAFFRVEAGIPFTITTAAGLVEVLGTTFNVYARNGILESLCTSGSIRTSSANGIVSEISTAGQGVRIENNQLSLTFDLDPQTTQWPEGQSHFEKVPLSRIIAELERQFSIDIQYEAGLFANTDLLTVWFDNQHLENALRNVFRPMRIRYEQNGSVIRLTAE